MHSRFYKSGLEIGDLQLLFLNHLFYFLGLFIEAQMENITNTAILNGLVF